MYDIRQFRPTLYVLLFLGFCGFAIAALTPGLWMVSVMLLAFNAWLVKTGRFSPMPRWAANLVTIPVLFYVFVVMRSSSEKAIMTIGQCLVLLQLLKLFEQRANRDYAQLLLLSLFLMVAAAMNTASLVFGVLFFVYLFISLYCCLLFHLKCENDAARAVYNLPDAKFNPATLRQDQHYLSRSMRRLTGLVSFVSIATAVFVFLFFPRGAGEGIFGRRLMSPEQALTGFSDKVSFQQVARIARNDAIVARVKVTINGQAPATPGPLLLRGMTLDSYSGRSGGGPMWQWRRTISGGEHPFPIGEGETASFTNDMPPNAVTQEINLQPTASRVLFAVSSPVSLRVQRNMSIRYYDRDGIVQSEEPLDQAAPLEYTVISTGKPPPVAPPASADLLGTDSSQIDPKIRAMAHNPEVCGVDARGRSLADARAVTPLVAVAATQNASNSGDGSPTTQPSAQASPLDDQIASNIATYLRTKFTYTLDLTDASNILAGQDPMVAFLYDLKRGHCEYFAGAMTLMCQSLGMQARVVVGFRSDEYNPVGQFYVVRQSHAHAWVEVLTADGWKTYDPTSGREDIQRQAGLVARLKQFFDFLDYKWGTSVITYGRGDRGNMISAMDTAMSKTAVNSSQQFLNLSGIANKVYEWIQSPTLIGGLITLMILGVAAAVTWFILDRLRLRRRAARIGLTNLPGSEQHRLARQLGFYDDLIRLLERHRITRPAHLTPREFSTSLTFLPNAVFDEIQRITDVFYRIRYGKAVLSPPRQRQLGTVISRIEETMGRPQRQL
jgi:transglutaminase-like putative cysteine protease